MLVPSSLGMGTGTLAAERPRRYMPSCQIDPTWIVASMRRRTLVKLVTYPVVLIVIVIVLVWINATFLLITT